MEGFEPPTAWFVARYSIQLSYMRVSFLYSFDVSSKELMLQKNLYVCTAGRNVIKLALNRKFFTPLFHTLCSLRVRLECKNGGEGGIRTLDRAINPILP